MYSMQFAGEAFSPNLQSALRIAWPSGLSSGKLNMYKLEMCLGSVADIARGWVYDDGVVVSVSSAQNYLERIRAEFGTDCLALHSSGSTRSTRPSSSSRGNRIR